MLSTRKLASTVLGAFLALTMVAAPVDAQEAVTLDFAGGVGIPAGDLADFQELGPAFDIGVNIGLHPRFSLRASGGVEFMDGQFPPNSTAGDQFDMPDQELIHFNAGAVFHALPDNERVSLNLNLGAGATIWTSRFEEISVVANGTPGIVEVDVNEIGFGGTAGLDIGYMVSDQVEFFVGGDGHLFIIDDESDSVRELTLLSSSMGPDDAPSTGFSFPVAGGVRFHFEP